MPPRGDPETTRRLLEMLRAKMRSATEPLGLDSEAVPHIMMPPMQIEGQAPGSRHIEMPPMTIEPPVANDAERQAQMRRMAQQRAKLMYDELTKYGL